MLLPFRNRLKLKLEKLFLTINPGGILNLDIFTFVLAQFVEPDLFLDIVKVGPPSIPNPLHLLHHCLIFLPLELLLESLLINGIFSAFGLVIDYLSDHLQALLRQEGSSPFFVC